MRLSSFVFIAAAVSLALACAGVQEPDGGPQPPADVTVRVTCPAANSQGAMTVAVQPFMAELDVGQDATVALDLNGPGGTSIRVSAKDQNSWPYPDTDLQDNQSVTFTEMRTTPDPSGEYEWSVEFVCNNRTVTLDPVWIVR